MTLFDVVFIAAHGRGYKIAGLELHREWDGTRALLGFGGSDSARDWARNLDTTLAPWPGTGPGRVHLGWYQAALLVYRQCRRLIKGATEIEIGGHSFGGAFGILLGLALLEDGFPVTRVETFGSPRVGDLEFSRSYPIPVTRYICGRDPVPNLPWWGYSDMGPPVRLPTQLGWLRKNLPWWRWYDHRLFSYRDALKEVNYGTLSPTNQEDEQERRGYP